MIRAKIGLSIATACLGVALIWWAEIIYRLWLFFTDYQMKRYENHTGDGYFIIVHFVLGCFLAGGLVSATLLAKERKSLAVGSLIPTVLGVLAWLTVQVMHRTGVLIGYMEWIGKIKGVQ